MPNTREKLVEITQYNTTDFVNPFAHEYGEDAERFADHLIANGVTLDKQVASSSKQLASSKWISVKDRLPKEDGNYLVFQQHTYGTAITTVRFAKDARKVDKYDFVRGWKNVWFKYDSEYGHYTLDDVTHWMPLPEPPKGE
jgi:hypothetical protein